MAYSWPFSILPRCIPLAPGNCISFGLMEMLFRRASVRCSIRFHLASCSAGGATSGVASVTLGAVGGTSLAASSSSGAASGSALVVLPDPFSRFGLYLGARSAFTFTSASFT